MTTGDGIRSTALVLFSGGQDSTVCLAWALDRYDHVETVGFDYGQRHDIELACRKSVRAEIARRFPDWGARLGDDHMIEMPGLAQVSETALTRNVEISMQQNGLPNTFVPGRNLLFFTYASALGYRRGLKTLVGGMCETDYSGYPDCRNDTLQSLAHAIRLGTETDFSVETPLMYLSKAQTWEMAETLGRRRAGRSDHRAHPHLLSRRTRQAPRVGLWMRVMSGVRVACARICTMV